MQQKVVFMINLKRKIQFVVVMLFLPLLPILAYASQFGPDFGFTGAPGDNGNCTSCHAGNVGSGPGSVSITGIPIAYTPGQTYPITVTVQQNGRQKFGFQLTVIDAGNNRAGTLVALSGETQILNITGQGGRQYLEHTQPGTNGAGSRSWQTQWTAPATDIGAVRFFVAGNAANNDGGSGGDSIYLNSYLSDPRAAIPVTIALTSELADQIITAGSVQRINWNTTGQANINLIEVRYSSDDGATFPITNLIFSTADVNSTGFDWTVPNTPTTQARLRVQASNGQGGVSESRSGRFTIQSDGTPVNRPVITSVTLKGAKLFVNGSNYQEGAIVEMDGVDQKTATWDPPGFSLRCKKAGNRIVVGVPVTLVVRNPDGSKSDAFLFTRTQ
jgi:hypothetical protein